VTDIAIEITAADIIPKRFIINFPSCIVLLLDEYVIDQTDYDF
jgi:hypothetical protein